MRLGKLGYAPHEHTSTKAASSAYLLYKQSGMPSVFIDQATIEWESMSKTYKNNVHLFQR